MSIDAIFFDLDDTLFSTSEFAAKARRASCVAMTEVGLRVDLADLETELGEVVSEFASNYDHHFDQLLRRIPRRYYKGVNPAIIVAAAVKAYHDMKVVELRPYPGVVDLLRDLSRRRRLVRGIISSGLTVKQAEKLLRLDIYRYLTPTAIYISEQIGINKPNVKLFRRACSDLNLKPARCIYVGDRMARDVDPANALGMLTVHFKGRGRHANELGETAPTHVVEDYAELRRILTTDYGLALGGDGADAGGGPPVTLSSPSSPSTPSPALRSRTGHPARTSSPEADSLAALPLDARDGDGAVARGSGEHDVAVARPGGAGVEAEDAADRNDPRGPQGNAGRD